MFRLDGLQYIGSAGTRCLIRARTMIEGRGGLAALVNAQATVHKVFQSIHARPANQIFATEAELDASRGAMPRRAHGERRPSPRAGAGPIR